MFSATIAGAQRANDYTLAQKQLVRERAHERPRMLLIEIKNNLSEISALRKIKPSYVQGYIKKTKEVRDHMVRDFNENFRFCPVYYFMDSNTDAVRQRHFDGVLLDKNLQPLSTSPLAATDTDYYVVYYGSFIPQPDSEHSTPVSHNELGPDREHDGDDPTSLRHTLLAMNYRFVLLSEDQPRTYKGRYWVPYLLLSREERRIYVRSSFEGLDYRNVANYYSKTLTSYFDEGGQ